MVVIKKQVKVPKNREIIVKIPENIPLNQSVEIQISTKEDSKKRREKIEMLKESVNDPIFQEDMKEVADDFKYIDAENSQ